MSSRRSQRLQQKNKAPAISEDSGAKSSKDNDGIWTSDKANYGGPCQLVKGKCSGQKDGNWTAIKCVDKRDDPEEPNKFQYKLHYLNSEVYWWTSNVEGLAVVKAYNNPEDRSLTQKGLLAAASKSTRLKSRKNSGPFFALTSGYTENHCILIALNVFFGRRLAESFGELFALANVTAPKQLENPKMTNFSVLKLAEGKFKRETLLNFKKVRRGGMGHSELREILRVHAGDWLSIFLYISLLFFYIINFYIYFRLILNATKKGYILDEERVGQTAHCYNIRLSGDEVEFVDEETGSAVANHSEYGGTFDEVCLVTSDEECPFFSWFLYKYKLVR